MPWLVGALLTGLVDIAGSLVGRVLLSLGAATVTYAGFGSSLTFLKTQALQHLTALPPEVVGMLSVLQVGTCVSILFSALTARLVVNGLTGDTIKKWVTK